MCLGRVCIGKVFEILLLHEHGVILVETLLFGIVRRAILF
jgi:hypothetical protein